MSPVAVGVRDLLVGMPPRAGSAPSDAPSDAPPADADAPDRPAAGAAFRRTAPVISAKGLDAPATARLHYSAPGESGEVQERDVDASGAPASGAPAGGGARRAQPRRSSKKARRRGK